MGLEPSPTPVPGNLRTLVDPNFGFFDGWDYEFGQYRWFYVAGYVELMSQASLKRRNKDLDVIKKHCPDVAKDVPGAWKDLYSGEDYGDDWKTISTKQIEYCVKRKPMKFAKASMSCICLERALRRSAKFEGNTYRNLEIRPAIFYIDGFKRVFDEHIVGHEDRRRALTSHALQEKFGVFRSMASGYTVTHQTAALTLEYLKSTLTGPQVAGLTVEYKTERGGNDGNALRPADEETIVYLKKQKLVVVNS